MAILWMGIIMHFRFIFALWLLLMNVKLGAVYQLELCYYYYVILKHAALIRRGV